MTESGPIEVRQATADDAPALLALRRVLAEETDYLLPEPDEVPEAPDGLAEHLEMAAERGNCAWFITNVGGEPVGLLSVDGGRMKRNARTARVFLGVARSYWGRGVGRELMLAAETWAKGAGLRRLEVTVMVHNERARKLYERLGYEVEGLLRESLFVDGEPVDEYALAKLI